MSKKTIFIGNQSNDGTGDSIRDAFDKANQNFDELYSLAGAGTGLYFTKSLVDTPKHLIGDTITNASSIIAVNRAGNSLTNKILYAGTGMQIISTGSSIYIINTSSNLYSDPNPTLSANLLGGPIGSPHQAKNFADPTAIQDLATKNYVDTNSFASSVNLYVSTSGNDSRTGTRAGRALAYAFRTINKACRYAADIIRQSTVELGPDQKYITIGAGYAKAQIYSITASTKVPGNWVISVLYTGDGTDPWNESDIRPGQYIRGENGAIGFIDYLSNVGNAGNPKYESYDVQLISTQQFQTGSTLMYGTPVATTNITIFVESGIYEEQYPIKVPANCSIRGDEFRRVLVRPQTGIPSTSTWVGSYFYRDKTFDGLTIASTGTLSSNGLGYYGYHYLRDPSRPFDSVTNPGKNNEELDVFLMNDQTILRAISAQGHGGFMVVLDPEGQILTKSPYIQNCSSISRSLNTQTFAGGMYIDGNVGNLQARPANTTTYFLGTLTVAVTGLTVRIPQVPCAFIVNGIRNEVDYVEGWSTSTGAAILHLNPLAAGGIAVTNGIIPVNSGTGYTSAPTVQFSPPNVAGGVVAQGTATISGGIVTQINLSSPGSGYTIAPAVTFTGGGYATPATVTVTTASISKGFVGKLPTTIEIGTAGYRSALAADFTQLNDLGYGIVVTNIGFSELVSVFAYFCHVGYYANNGAQIGSSNGAIKYGDFALKAEGADNFEVPIPVRLINDMVTTATVVSQTSTWGLYTVNTASDTTIYVQNWSFVPNAQSILEVDHGSAVDATGKLVGRVSYVINNAGIVSNTATIVQINLNTAGGLGSLRAPIIDSTGVLIRGSKVFTFTGVDTTTISRPSTALDFTEAQSLAYHVLNYDASGLTTGTSNITLKEPYNYIQLAPTVLPNIGDTTIHINSLSTSSGVTTIISDSQRVINSLAAGGTPYIFAWGGQIHTINSFSWQGTTSTIVISPALDTAITTSTIVLYAGLKGNNAAEITTRISILRATGQDFVDVGAGGRETANIPNDIYGPARKQKDSKYEVIEVGKGRVFVTATDQDGNFRVGTLFEVNQGTGAATLNASISLTGIVGLGFQKGVPVVDEFSTDEVMNPSSSHIVPVQSAVANHVSRRLGLNAAGAFVSKLGSGYLDLTGLQAMAGTLRTGGWPIDMGSTATGFIYNLQTPPFGANTTATYYAANKIYVDTNDALKVSRTGDTMLGALILSQDPVYTDPLLQATTRRYVDKIRQLSTLSDVTLTGAADTDFLMLADPLAVNTATVQPIWNATRRVINVANSVSSDIGITRSGNTVNFQINSGVITNAEVSATAAIAQSKLLLTTATTVANSANLTPAGLGVASFDLKFFTATPNGWISLTSPPAANYFLGSSGTSVTPSWQSLATAIASFAVTTATGATKLIPGANINNVLFDGSSAINVNLVNALTAGSYLTSSGTFDGSAARTFAVNATSANTVNTVVARDASGNFSAGTITATLSGSATYANSAGSAGSATTAGSAGNLTGGTVTGNYTLAAGVSFQSTYADLAEWYSSDAEYEPGTVIVFGGDKEATMSTQPMDRKVAGVVTTNPAYTLNAGLEGTKVCIALVGRVPCKVVGLIHKGDMLVSSGIPGVAIAELDPKMGTVIGKALEDYNNTEVGVIEVVVGRL